MRRQIVGFACLAVVAVWTYRACTSDSSRATGRERSYACELTLRAVAPAGTLVDLRTTGTLRLTVLADGSDVIVRARLSEATLSLAGTAAGGKASDAVVQRELAQPFYLTYRSDGALTDVRTSGDVSPIVAGVFRALGASIVVASPTVSAPEWHVTEHDAGGAYVAAFRTLDDAHLVKQKHHYEDAPTTIVRSRTELTFDGAGQLREAQTDELLRGEHGALPGIETALSVALRYRASRDRSADVADGLREHVRAARLRHVATAQRTFDEAAIAGWDYSGLLAALRAADGVDKPRAARAYAGLTAFLRLHPEQLATVRTQIVGGSPLANTLIAALRDAGTPETQKLLAALLDEPLLADRHPRIARGLSLVEHPTADTVARLQGLEHDDRLHVQATYGLGSALHRLRESDPALAATILGHLTSELAAATTVARITTLLGALGNAGHPDALALARHFLGSDDERIRAAACGAIRRIPGALADDALGVATRDASPVVRGAAVEALARRSPTHVLASAIAERLVSESEFLIRSRAVYIAAAWLTAMPTLEAPLSDVARNDTSADLRRIATAAVQ